MANQKTLAEALKAAVAACESAGIETPQLDAEILAAESCGFTRTELFLNLREPIAVDKSLRFEQLLQRRIENRESIAHILGRRGFRYIELEVDGRVLIPRPETELLVEVGLTAPRGATVLDVGTGSGAIAVALKSERPDLNVWASDISTAALAVAKRNARRLGTDIHFFEADLLDSELLRSELAPNLILSNPPYIPDADLASLSPEVALHDPHLALFGGDDGLTIVRRLIRQAADLSCSKVAVEIGAGQAKTTSELMTEAGFSRVQIIDDLAGIGRIVVGESGVSTSQ